MASLQGSRDWNGGPTLSLSSRPAWYLPLPPSLPSSLGTQPCCQTSGAETGAGRGRGRSAGASVWPQGKGQCLRHVHPLGSLLLGFQGRLRGSRSQWASVRVRKRLEPERFLETGSVSHWCGESCSQDSATKEPELSAAWALPHRDHIHFQALSSSVARAITGL